MKIKNLKVGDKLLCKKDYYSFSSLIFHKNEYYIVFRIENNSYIYIINDYNTYSSFFYDESLFVYFYKKQELRNMKLKKLYEDT